MSGLRKSLVLGLAASIVGLVFSIIPFGLDLEEEAGLALLFKLRGPKPAPSDVVVVSIDKASADRLGLLNEPRKWPRSLHAKLTEILADRGAAAIAFDVFFEEPRSADDDAALAEAVRKAGNVVLSQRLLREKINFSDNDATIEKIVPPLPQFADAALARAPFLLPKIPVRVGQDWTFKAGSGDMPTMPVVAFQVYALDVYDDFLRLLGQVSPKAAVGLPADRTALASGGNVADTARAIRQRFEADPPVAGKMLARLKAFRSDFQDEKRYHRLRALILMYRGEGIRYLNYYGPAGTITTVPYDQVLSGASEIDFKGKVVFVGFSELYQPEQKDSFYTVYSTKDGTDLSGVEIGATEFANLLDDSSIKPLDFRDHALLVILWGFALGFGFVRFSMAYSLPGSLAVGAGYLVFALYQFKANTLWYPVVTPLFLQIPITFVGATVWKYVDVSRERRNIRAAFGHYLPDEVIDKVAKDITKIGADNRVVYGVCLYTDIAGYTTLAERLSAEDLSKVINQYYEAVFKPIRKHGGIISNAVGDSILALWVAPRPDANLVNNACNAALDVERVVRKFRYDHASGPIFLPTRIAVHSGQILLGSIGAMDHYEYRPVGDMVNTVTRIEGLNKLLKTTILVSADVAGFADKFLLREAGEFLLAGKALPLGVYEMVCRLNEAGNVQLEARDIFSRGLAAFRRQSWGEAADIFRKYVTSFGDDGPAAFYLEKSEEYKESPAPSEWDGVIRLHMK